jgi:hypothetical protein
MSSLGAWGIVRGKQRLVAAENIEASNLTGEYDILLECA